MWRHVGRNDRMMSSMMYRHKSMAPPLMNLGDTQKKPDHAVAAAMQREYFEFPNEILLLMAAHGDHEARRERLTREIMCVDAVNWENAQPKVAEIARATHHGITMVTTPFRLVIYTSLLAGLASFPLCFHLDTALWFNEHFVTAEVASGEDLETMLEVGSWTWNWMEPPLGQISFFILCLQLARDQGANIGKKSFVEILKARRANSVANKFPSYNRKIVEDFAETEFNNNN